MMAAISPQGRGIAKGFGVGMIALLLVYGGLFSWVTMNGPTAREHREGQMVSRTVMIERVLPMDPALLAPVQGPPAPTAKTEHPAEESPTTVESSKPEPVATPKPEPVAEVQKEHDPLKDEKAYANGMLVAPVEGLYEDVEAGRLPLVRADGISPFKAYKKPFTNVGNKPVISIAVADMGLSEKITESAIKSLPPEVSLIVSPYANGPDMWTTEAREGGHEVWLSLPMESATYPKTDSGPHTLLIGAPERENLQKLDWVMSRAVGYAGLIATYQPEFMNAQNDLRPILGSLYKRGVGFMSSSPAGSLPETMALSMNAPYSKMDVWIDKPEATPEIIKASLQQLEVIAKENGYAAGIISPSAVSFRELQAWMETLKGKGIALAPLSVQTGY